MTTLLWVIFPYICLAIFVVEAIAEAGGAPDGRVVRVVVEGPPKVLVVGFAAGGVLPDHTRPGPATLQVLRGRLELSTADRTWDLPTGALVEIPEAVHAVRAQDPGAMVLTISA